MPRLPSSRRGKKKVAPKDGPSGHQSSPHTFPHHPGVGLALPRLTGGRKHQIYKTHQCLPCCARRDLELDRCRDPTQTTRRILKQFPIFVAASLSLDLVCHPKFFAFVLVVSTCTESADLYHLEFPPNFAIGCGTETASMMASSPTYSCSGSSGSSNCSWQERLEGTKIRIASADDASQLNLCQPDFCQKAQLTSPIFHIVSDRRGTTMLHTIQTQSRYPSSWQEKERLTCRAFSSSSSRWTHCLVQQSDCLRTNTSGKILVRRQKS